VYLEGACTYLAEMPGCGCRCNHHLHDGDIVAATDEIVAVAGAVESSRITVAMFSGGVIANNRQCVGASGKTPYREERREECCGRRLERLRVLTIGGTQARSMAHAGCREVDCGVKASRRSTRRATRPAVASPHTLHTYRAV